MYYPLSQIQTNLYTNGGEYVYKKSTLDYTGYYWKTSDGKFFTGKTPEDINIQEIVLISSLNNKSQSNLNSTAFVPDFTLVNTSVSTQINVEYNKLNKQLINVNKVPVSFNPKPTQSDYDLGEITRYFCKKTNELLYLEISKNVYDSILDQNPSYLWQLYIPFKYQWIITGEEKQAYTTNKNITEYMMQKYNFPSFNKFLKEDYLKFWKLK